MRRLLLPAVLVLLFVFFVLFAGGCDLINPARSPGEKLYRDNCAKCHGSDGSGNTPAYMGNPNADLTDDFWKHGGDDVGIANSIRDGVFGEMPPFKQLSDQEVKELTRYVRSLHRETASP